MKSSDDVWFVPPTNLVLCNEDVHVWRCSLDRPQPQVKLLYEMASAFEKDRAERFRFEKDRSRFIIAHGLLRVILGRYLKVAPNLLQYCYGSNGKPQIGQKSIVGELCFNMSCSQGLVVYAFTLQRAVGVDLEKIRSIPEADQILKQFFSAQEFATFRSLSFDQRTKYFFDCWTRKEAFLKAAGEGLGGRMHYASISLANSMPTRILTTSRESNELSPWSFRRITPDSEYMAVLVVEGRDWHLTCLEGQNRIQY